MKFTLVSVAVAAMAAQQVLAGGPIAGCLQTHIVTATDSCDGIAAQFKLTPDQFYAMNPGLHHAGDHLCDNLDSGKAYCVCTKKPCVAESSASAVCFGCCCHGCRYFTLNPPPFIHFFF
ncbi:uncharacterized protein BX664DRAFT_21296 [Halteromyces radiatus]|uniref:uncharacterized protein n=1 Tax=Halteromyces radiatus TaxID=101107 RepID=UPI002220EC65|nr:uncharacterized protein BX664DRAFT_21296 [Halteromyces radiatus]KAI8099457.1 hypothetical protein BX664DRAFT_21296 [Halteromyces radiatus]